MYRLRPWQDSFGGQQKFQILKHGIGTTVRAGFFKPLSIKNKLSSCNIWHGIDTVAIKRQKDED
jgi:hypothetical protein